MKKILRNKIILMIILCVLSCGIGITASNIYQSNSIEYSPTDSSWEVSNVNEALNDLKTKYDDMKNNAQQIELIATLGEASAAKTVVQNINVSSYDDCSEFTTSSFLLDSTGVFIGYTSGTMNRAWVGSSHVKSYDTSTCIFSITTTESHSIETRGFNGKVYLIH